MVKLDDWGAMGAYIGGGATFDVYVKEQEVPDDQVDEHKQKWDYLVKFRAENPEMTMAVPTD